MGAKRPAKFYGHAHFRGTPTDRSGRLGVEFMDAAGLELQEAPSVVA